MRKAVLADTGPIYAVVDPDDAHHARALRELEQLASSQHEVMVTFPTLLEAYSLVMVRLGPKIALRWLDEMTYAALVNPSPEDYRNASVKLSGFADRSISLFDATVATIASRIGVPVWTYDHHFDVMRVPVWR